MSFKTRDNEDNFEGQSALKEELNKKVLNEKHSVSENMLLKANACSIFS